MKHNKKPSNDAESFTMMRVGNDLSEMDRSFDIEYWQRQGDQAIFNAAWEMVELYMRDKGMDSDEFRLQRTVEHFQRTKRYVFDCWRLYRIFSL